MKRAIFILIAGITMFFITGCGVTKKAPKMENLSLKVIQTLSECEALAVTANYEPVKIIVFDDLIYDGKTYRGYFVLVDTYTYTTRKNIQKTVPVYISYSDYKMLKKESKDKQKLTDNIQ